MKAPVTVLIALLALASCQSAPAPLAPDASPEIYFQRAQNATDQSQYDEALEIYRSFLANRPDASTESQFSARYEIAFLLSKKGLTAEAQSDFESILADFDNLEKSAGAPSWVKVLTQKILQKLKDKAAKTRA